MKKIGLLSSLFLIILLASCAHPKPLVYQDMENFHVRLVKQPPVSFTLKLYNPNPYPMVLKNVNVDVYINNNRLGALLLDTVYSAPPLQSFLLPLALNIDMRNIFPNAARLIFDSSVAVKLQGHVKVAWKHKGISVPIDYEGVQALDKPRMMLLDDKRK